MIGIWTYLRNFGKIAFIYRSKKVCVEYFREGFMQKQITFRQYRAMDLFFFTAILCLSELLITLGATRWFRGEAYTLSLSCAVMAIVMVRWGAWAAVPVAAGNLVFCLVYSMTHPVEWTDYLVYVLGSQMGLVMLLYLKKVNWQKLKEDVLLALLYGLLTALSMQVGRMLVALVLGAPFGACTGYITTDVLSTFFSVLLVWIARRLDGMLEEQKHYLLRVQKEMQNGQT